MSMYCPNCGNSRKWETRANKLLACNDCGWVGKILMAHEDGRPFPPSPFRQAAIDAAEKAKVDYFESCREEFIKTFYYVPYNIDFLVDSDLCIDVDEDTVIVAKYSPGTNGNWRWFVGENDDIEVYNLADLGYLIEKECFQHTLSGV